MRTATLESTFKEVDPAESDRGDRSPEWPSVRVGILRSARYAREEDRTLLPVETAMLPKRSSFISELPLDFSTDGPQDEQDLEG